MERANPSNHPPNRTIANVLAAFQNVDVERFAVWRQALAVRPKTSGSAPGLQERVSVDPDHSRLAAVIVLLIPVAAAAWAAIGWLVYRLAT